MLKSQVALNELEHDSIDIMCSSIINKYNNHFNEYEYLSLAEFHFFVALKKHFKTLQTQNYYILIL